MSYATIDELAGALRIRVNETNEATLQACLDAAAREIDHEVDWFDPTADPDPESEGYALLNRVNIVRGVEWFKSNDAAFGVIGFAETGALHAPRDAFNRHALALTPLKEQWGIA